MGLYVCGGQRIPSGMFTRQTRQPTFSVNMEVSFEHQHGECQTTAFLPASFFFQIIRMSLFRKLQRQ